MEYIEHTEQVREFLLRRSDLRQRIGQIFEAHARSSRKVKPLRSGSTRCVYEVSRRSEAPSTVSLEWDGMSDLTILLKLGRPPFYPIDYGLAQTTGSFGGYWQSLQRELAMFEVYYDVARGHGVSVSFKSREAYLQFREGCSSDWETRYLYRRFVLNDERRSVGTFVEPGDLGALPYFQLVVRYRDWFGVLTEGCPSLITPTGNSRSRYPDSGTSEGGRLIDFGPMEDTPSQSWLLNIDAGHQCVGGFSADNLGIRPRGAKYVATEHTLFL